MHILEIVNLPIWDSQKYVVHSFTELKSDFQIIYQTHADCKYHI